MKYRFIIGLLTIVLFSNSCAEKIKVDTSKAPEEIVIAIEASYQLSKELTDIQIDAGSDKVLDSSEIENIGKVFRELASLNNENKEKYGKDLYFLAISKERKAEFDKLSESVIFLKDCKGYDELGLLIQKIAIEIN